MSVPTSLNLILVVLFSVLAARPVLSPALSKPAGQQYFPESGHHVSGDFLRAYQAVEDPLLLFGYPITESFQDQTTGRTVQYFQRVRFELHPDEPEPLRVKLTPLGRYLYKAGGQVSLPENFPACQEYPETGKQVCYAFLEFFNAHGGVAQFGYPISNFEIQDGRIVQYFQLSRFEWHPEYPPGQRVILTNLGSLYFAVRGENPMRLMASRDTNAPATVLSLRVRAFPLRAVTRQEGVQTVYVVVQDQNMQPMANIQAVMSFRSPSGKESSFNLPQTDENGIAQLTFSFEGMEPGIAQIVVTTTFAGLEQHTETSFRVWW